MTVDVLYLVRRHFTAEDVEFAMVLCFCVTSAFTVNKY